MSSSYNVGPDRAAAAAKVNGPAIALMIIAGLGCLAQLFSFLMKMAGMGGEIPAIPGAPPELEQILVFIQGPLGIVMGLFSLVIGVVIFVGALRMKALGSYGFAMAAAVLAMIPCVSPCCCLGLPVGIWAIIVLVDQNVKASFV